MVSFSLWAGGIFEGFRETGAVTVDVTDGKITAVDAEHVSRGGAVIDLACRPGCYRV
jgi:hypothetical protein